MLIAWLPVNARMENMEAEAEGLVRDFGGFAYGEVRRREDEASSDEIARQGSFRTGGRTPGRHR